MGEQIEEDENTRPRTESNMNSVGLDAEALAHWSLDLKHISQFFTAVEMLLLSLEEILGFRPRH